MTFKDLKYGDKVAIQDININNQVFYVEATFLEYTPRGFIITIRGTFGPDGRGVTDLNKIVMIIDESIQKEIRKSELRKFFSKNPISSNEKLTLEDLVKIYSIVEESRTSIHSD